MIISLASNFLITKMGGWVFISFGGISIVGVIFFIIFMKETKGLTQPQIDRLYRRDMNEISYGIPAVEDED